MTGRAGLLVGILIGGAVTAGAFLLWRDSRTPTSNDENTSERSNAGVPPDDASRLPLGTGAAPNPATLTAGKSGATTDRPPTPAEAEFLRKALAEERRRSLAARIRAEDSGLDVLRRILDERADPAEVLGDFDRFASHVRAAKGRVARFAESSGDAPIVLRESEAKGAAILEFGPGRFVIDTNGWDAATRDATELEIRGAGKDRTFLVPQRDLLMATTNLDHLRIHDVTVETAAGMTLDIRANAAAILEDVRFLHWEAAGHASVIGVSGKGYVGLRRCEFMGGGARRGFGISLRGPAVVLAEDCTFSDVAAAVIGGSGTAFGSVVRLSHCRFLGSPLADRGGKRGEASEIEIDVVGGEALLGGKDLSEEDRRLQWGAPFAASVAGVVFGPDPARPTVGDLLAVLDAVKSDVPGTPISVSFVSAERLGLPSSFSLGVWDGKSERPSVYTVRMQGGKVTIASYPQGGGPGVPKPGELDGVSPLADVLRRSGVSGTTDATQIVLQISSQNDKRVVQVFVMADRRVTAVVDALTAEVVRQGR